MKYHEVSFGQPWKSADPGKNGCTLARAAVERVDCPVDPCTRSAGMSMRETDPAGTRQSVARHGSAGRLPAGGFGDANTEWRTGLAASGMADAGRTFGRVWMQLSKVRPGSARNLWP